MTHEKIVAALREHAEWAAGNEWETPITLGDDLSAAADLIENQQREIEALRQANEGSDPSAASGGYSEVSEWPRSKFQASAVRQRRNFGHRNRVIRNTLYLTPPVSRPPGRVLYSTARVSGT